MKLKVHRITLHRHRMQTRFPFRYGIASMSVVPHLFVRAEIEVDGGHCIGIASDGLAPKWFTKDPTTDYEQDDVPAMVEVVRHAARIATDLGNQPSVFHWWRELHRTQHTWAQQTQRPPLLTGFGVSLIERAVIDGFCRQLGVSFSESLQQNLLGVDFAAVRPALASLRPEDVIPHQPRDSVQLRHTIGLGDPLVQSEITERDQLDDGLPHALVDCIRHYGLRYFKVKLSGDTPLDRDRMTDLAAIFQTEVGDDLRFTLDGNEQFSEVSGFRDSWSDLRSVPAVRDMIDRGLLFVEQPLHRSTALRQEVKSALRDWNDAPPMIIDESDAELDSLPTALELGYSGTSHKNCKGVFKSLLAAATLRQRHTPGKRLILSAEDLVNVGPVALLQDLAVVSTLGIEHVERNGHHYFAGLQMFPESIQQQVTEDHPELYRWHENQFATLKVADGRLQLGSVNRAPLGVATIPDLTSFEELTR